MPSPEQTETHRVGPDDDPTGEVARLRAEVAHLRATAADRERVQGERRGRWRPLVAGLLVALAALTAPLSVVASWAGGQLQDTDRYVATVAPLADDPDVQAAVATRIEQVVLSYLDLDSTTDELVAALTATDLPPRAVETLRGLSGPLESGVRQFVRARIDALVRSDAFREAWVAANRTAHGGLVAALTGDTDGAVSIDRGQVSVDLAVLVGTIRSQLVDAGFGIAERIPEVEASFALVQSDELSQVQLLVGVLDDLALVLPVLGLTLLVVAVVVARDRSRVVVAAGLAVAASMVLLGAALDVARPLYLEALPADSSAAAAGAVFDQLVLFIRVALRGVVVVALVVALVAWLCSSRGTGAAARGSLAAAAAAARRRRQAAGLGTGRLGHALTRFRGPVRVVVASLAAVAYLALDHPTAAAAAGCAVVAAAALLVTELLATEGR